MRARRDESAETLLMKANISRFDTLVARYYPAVYGLAVKLTDDPREAVALTRAAFSGAQKQLSHLRSKTTIATVLLTAVLRAGIASA
jgi:DNA-directed RNA polymerase specialized sigma24 family protein